MSAEGMCKAVPVTVDKYGHVIGQDGFEICVYGVSLSTLAKGAMNRDLLVEAINVRATSGKTPRQLADEVNQLKNHLAAEGLHRSEFNVQRERLTRERDALLGAAKVVVDQRGDSLRADWDALDDAIALAEQQMAAGVGCNDENLSGMWSHSDFTGGDPDERSYAERAATKDIP